MSIGKAKKGKGKGAASSWNPQHQDFGRGYPQQWEDDSWNNDGWGGGNPQYASNYDHIFGNKNGSTKKAAPEQTAPQPAAQALDARDALALRRILRESGESSALKEILEESGWRRSG